MENYKKLEKQYKEMEQKQVSDIEKENNQLREELKEFDLVQKRYEELLTEVNTRDDLIIKMKTENERLRAENERLREENEKIEEHEAFYESALEVLSDDEFAMVVEYEPGLEDTQ